MTVDDVTSSTQPETAPSDDELDSSSSRAEPTAQDDRSAAEAEPPPAGQHGYVPQHAASVYDTEIDLRSEDDAHSRIIDLTGDGKRVLELGCATGSTTKVLLERGCQVVGIEVDAQASQIAEQFCERVIVADLDLLDVSVALGDDTFDVIIAADVLEHLRDPRRVLTACLAHLRPSGEVLLSIPNVAHGDVRLSLLRGDFEYQWCGLLDETHMRFFTRRSLESFLDDCGLVALAWDRTQRELGDTEICWDPPYGDELVHWVAAQPDADTYQFVVRAGVGPEGSHLRELGDRVRELEGVEAANNQLTGEVEGLAAEVEGLGAEVERLDAEVQRVAGEKQALVQHAHDAQLRSRLADERAEAEVSTAQRALGMAERELQAALERVEALEAERDEYRSSFGALLGVQEDLVAVRRSESFRLGRALLAPFATTRRVARAWRRAKTPS